MDGKETAWWPLSEFKPSFPGNFRSLREILRFIDVHTQERRCSVNLPAVVEQAVKECKYFGWFVYEGRRLQVVRIDPSNKLWNSRGF